MYQGQLIIISKESYTKMKNFIHQKNYLHV